MSNSNDKTNKIQLLKSNGEIAREQQIKQKEIFTVLAAQEKERAKIGHEIQENLNQVLVAALLYVEQAKIDVENREICLERSSSFISSVIKGLTNISRTLQTGILI